MLPVLEPFEYAFMQRALLAGLVVAAVSALLGVFLVLRGQSMIGDGIAHIAFGGVALGLLLNLYPLGAALAFAILGAIGIQLLRQRGVVLSDTAISIFFTTGLALGVILVSLGGGFNVDLFGYLFGSLVAVSARDVWLVAGLGLLLLAVVLLLYKEMFYVTFSEEAARVSGLPVNAMNLLFSVLTAVTIVVAARVVGVLLVSALLVVPAATALQLTTRFTATLATSVALGLAAVVAGLYAAYAFDLAAGGAIALVSVLAFFGTLAAKRTVAALRAG